MWISLQWGLSSYWIDSYWGGAASATGGALLAGAAARLRNRVSVRQSMIFAFGLALLANTRPYEGFLLGSVMVVWLIARIIRLGLPYQVVLLRVVAPMCSVLIVTAAGMAIYFARVTGNPVRTPYQAYIEQYAASPAFVWQKRPPEPVYRHQELRDAHLSFLSDYKRFDNPLNAVQFSLYKLRLLGTFYVGPLLFVPIVALPWLLRGRTRLALIAVLGVLGGILLTVSVQPHYGAPLTVFFIILTLQALRFFWIARRLGNPIGEYLTPAAAVICAAYIAFLAASPHQRVILSARPKVIDYLHQNGGKHLVIVRYGREHSLTEEWVYNSADVDGSDIVWARDMGPSGNDELLRYYPNRKTWLLLPESPVTQLVPYDKPH